MRGISKREAQALKAERIQRVLDAIAKHGEATMLQVEAATEIPKASVWFLMTDLEAQQRIHVKRWHNASAHYVVGPGESARRPRALSKGAALRLPKVERELRAANAAIHNSLMDAFFGRSA